MPAEVGNRWSAAEVRGEDGSGGGRESMNKSKGGRHTYIYFFKGEVMRETNVAV